MSKIATYNPYTSALHDTQREYKKLLEKHHLTPQDIKQQKTLSRRLTSLNALVRIFSPETTS